MLARRLLLGPIHNRPRVRSRARTIVKARRDHGGNPVRRNNLRLKRSQRELQNPDAQRKAAQAKEHSHRRCHRISLISNEASAHIHTAFCSDIRRAKSRSSSNLPTQKAEGRTPPASPSAHMPLRLRRRLRKVRPHTPKNSHQIVLSPAAREDVRDILLWSSTHFGSAAAARYRVLLIQTLRDLEADPLRPGSRSRPEVSKPARTYRLALSRKSVKRQAVKHPRHFILYRVEATGLEVARILHDSRDLDRHLPELY